MRVISRPPLIDFQKTHPDSKGALETWYHEAKKADWDSPIAIKLKYRSASFVGNNRVVFNICGNKYRLVVKLNYHAKIIFIRFIGTHRDYDTINVEEV
ncbi:MAG: type II toxin-antitoxin system HigB family toxin [Rhodospirillaceae bacterium]